jgi:hypothetical protein
VKRAVLVLAVGALAGAAEADPFNSNLKVLQQRAKVQEAQKKGARPARRGTRTRVQMARAIAPRPAVPAGLPIKYDYEGRFGSKDRGGDLVVYSPNEKALTHVYLKQRLVSNEGNGHARIPDLAPGKYPVMVWAPEKGKRRTYWVTIRPGSVAELTAEL